MYLVGLGNTLVSTGYYAQTFPWSLDRTSTSWHEINEVNVQWPQIDNCHLRLAVLINYMLRSCWSRMSLICETIPRPARSVLISCMFLITGCFCPTFSSGGCDCRQTQHDRGGQHGQRISWWDRSQRHRTWCRRNWYRKGWRLKWNNEL